MPTEKRGKPKGRALRRGFRYFLARYVSSRAGVGKPRGQTAGRHVHRGCRNRVAGWRSPGGASMRAPRVVATCGINLVLVRIPQLCGHGDVAGHGHQLWALTWCRLHPQWRLRWQRLHRWLVLLHEGIIRGLVLLIRKMIKGESDGRNGTAATADALNLGRPSVGAVRLHLARRPRSGRPC